MTISIGRRFVFEVTSGHIFVRVWKREAFIDFTGQIGSCFD